MNIKIEIHDNGFKRKLSLVDKWKVPDTTKKELRLFIEKAQIGQVNLGRKLSERTCSKYISLLKLVLQILNKQTSKLTKEDIEKFDNKLTKKNLSSAPDYRKALRVFLRWKIGDAKTNKISEWLDTRDKIKTPDYLSEQEIIKLFKGCKNSFERFLISILFDSGARIEEFLNIRKEDIQLPDQNNNFVKLTLKEEYSKTKGRVISLYWKQSLNSVRDFLKEEGDQIKSNEPIINRSYDSIRFFLLRLGKKVLNKTISPHLFRHSSATFYATKLNRQELCYRYGWKFSSNMPDVYISRSGMENKQLDEKFKSTELEELQKQIEKERFMRESEMESFRKETSELKQLLLKEIFDGIKTGKYKAIMKDNEILVE